MKISENDLHSLCQLLEEEVSIHRLLIQDINKESEYLRQGSVSLLMEVVKSIEKHTEMIWGLRKEEQEAISKMLIPFEPEGDLKSLLSALPFSDRQRIKYYQKTLDELKEWVQKINDQNKAFIQESLSFIGDIISWLIHPVSESPGYTPKGDQKSLSIPSPSLYREV